MRRVQLSHRVDVQLQRAFAYLRGGQGLRRRTQRLQGKRNSQPQQQKRGHHHDRSYQLPFHGPGFFSCVGSLSATFSPACNPPAINSCPLLRRATCTGRSSNFEPRKTYATEPPFFSNTASGETRIPLAIFSTAMRPLALIPGRIRVSASRICIAMSKFLVKGQEE